MEKKERTHTLEQKLAERLLRILEHKGCLDDAGDDEILETIAFDFEDGMTVTIDICNGSRDRNNSPYINASWFKDNVYLYAPDTEPDGELFGTYDFVYDCDDDEINYLLHLKYVAME